MTVWIFESNLMWSSRFLNSVKGFGYEGIVTAKVPDGDADAAIVNLSDPNVASIVAQLSAKGIYTVAHAGHKEKELLELGREIKVDRVATNSEITNKLESILAGAKAQKS
ncbi:MAG: hypothetical protein JST51_08575 [Armatimonadetes bacterium]|nr:hypothetical protein [Armatimonadota bacterium]